jgi:hypothetical protein
LFLYPAQQPGETPWPASTDEYDLVSIQAVQVLASSSAVRDRSSGRWPGMASVVVRWWATITRAARSRESAHRYYGASVVIVGQMSR